MIDSIAFDDAADRYDETRALAPEVMAEVVRALERELRGRGRCLEIGIGTGRVALPLHGRGIEMAGADLSAPMLGRLVEKAGGRAPFPIAIADATALPFRDGSFGAALAVHVLHLIPAWERAVRELARVVARGGAVLVDKGGGWHRGETGVGDRFARAAGVVRRHVGLEDDEAALLDRAMASLGARLRPLEPIEEVRTRSIAQDIDDMENGLWAWTWQIPPDVRRAAATEVREWARDRFGDLDAPIEHRRGIVFRVYELP